MALGIGLGASGFFHTLTEAEQDDFVASSRLARGGVLYRARKSLGLGEGKACDIRLTSRPLSQETGLDGTHGGMHVVLGSRSRSLGRVRRCFPGGRFRPAASQPRPAGTISATGNRRRELCPLCIRNSGRADSRRRRPCARANTRPASSLGRDRVCRANGKRNNRPSR